MNRIELPLCNQCNKPVNRPSEGFRINGRLTTATTDTWGYDFLNGNIAMKSDAATTLGANDFIYHRHCLMTLLSLASDSKSSDDEFVMWDQLDSEHNDYQREVVYGSVIKEAKADAAGFAPPTKLTKNVTRDLTKPLPILKKEKL